MLGLNLDRMYHIIMVMINGIGGVITKWGLI